MIHNFEINYDKPDAADLAINSNHCAKAARALAAAFNWSGAREGGEFWAYVAQRLCGLAERGGETDLPRPQQSEPGIGTREYYAAHAPVSYEMAKDIWGGNFAHASDNDRAAFFAVWAALRFEYADAMLAEAKGEAAAPPAESE